MDIKAIIEKYWEQIVALFDEIFFWLKDKVEAEEK